MFCCDGAKMLKIKGFTLIELMVTIGIMAIIATLAAPSFGNMLTNQKLKKTTVEMKIKLQEARSRALLTRSPTVVCPSTITLAACGANITGYATLNDAQKSDSVILVDIDPKVSIKSGSATNFLFTPMGKTTEKTITLCGENRSFTVSIFIPGTLQVEQGVAC